MLKAGILNLMMFVPFVPGRTGAENSSMPVTSETDCSREDLS